MISSCHMCGATALRLVDGFERLMRVTSDCRPWKAGGRLGCCANCHAVVSPINEQWRSEASEIYGSYAIYHQSAGQEQAVFTENGAAAARSTALVTNLLKSGRVPRAGRLLDLGCGNGAFLREFGAGFPEWRLVGSEFDDRNRAEIERLPHVESFIPGGLARVGGTFDLVSAIHFLEHVEDPVQCLGDLGRRLNDQGLLFVEVPYFCNNPFDLVIADHCTHFTPASLGRLLHRAGFEPLIMTVDWVAKELSVLARRGRPAGTDDMDSDPVDTVHKVVSWLAAVSDDCRRMAENGGLGLFGTSIAGTWLYAELAGRIDFFVDEDPQRQGRWVHDRPVFSPAEVSPDRRVYVGLPEPIATRIVLRLTRPGVTYRGTPPMPAALS